MQSPPSTLCSAVRVVALGVPLLQIRHVLAKPWQSACQAYAGWVNKQLAGYGLRYDDLYDPLKDEVG